MVDVAPDYTGRVGGVRCWRVANTLWAKLGGALWADSALEPWPDGEEYEATCIHKPVHVSPVEDCSCGIHAYHYFGGLVRHWYKPHDFRHVSGVVSGRGRIYLHDLGWGRTARGPGGRSQLARWVWGANGGCAGGPAGHPGRCLPRRAHPLGGYRRTGRSVIVHKEPSDAVAAVDRFLWERSRGTVHGGGAESRRPELLFALGFTVCSGYGEDCAERKDNTNPNNCL
jgi:hypothetical protein